MKYILDGSPDLREAARLLAEAHDADATTVNDLLVSPWVSQWAAVCARDLTQRRHRQAANGVALAAAVRSGLDGRGMILEPHDGEVVIPTLGALTRPERGRVTAADLRGPHWQPIRTITAAHGGRRFSVSVDDIDPYRNFHHLAVQSRLRGDQFQALAARFDGAWRLLAERCPARAAELSGGLSSITLLAGGESSGAQSATCSDAFGGLATTMPRDALELAVALVHEFQHSKLSAIAALVPLCDPNASKHRYFAPWRQDPRPLNALLHGIYAFAGIALLWRDLVPEPALGPVALREFAFVRAQLCRALDGVTRDEPGLTAAGRRLLARLSETIGNLRPFPVPPEAEAEAHARLGHAEAAWMHRHDAAK